VQSSRLMETDTIHHDLAFSPYYCWSLDVSLEGVLMKVDTDTVTCGAMLFFDQGGAANSAREGFR
jgi:hypothetical protein